ncbi:MAG: hypothetical protein JWP91_3871 [Fibrobacteres bacterium]|nr:hypothetical protein [Fibrobacterota bacterium]
MMAYGLLKSIYEDNRTIPERFPNDSQETPRMNPVQIHLALNHAPLFGILSFLALFGYGMYAAKEELKKAGLAGLLVFSLVTPFAFFSGEKSEDRVERLDGISREDIHAHEEAGESAFAFAAGMGAIAAFQLLLYLFPNSAGLRRKTAWAVLLISLIALGTMAYAARTGGHIRHGEELGKGPAVPGGS